MLALQSIWAWEQHFEPWELRSASMVHLKGKQHVVLSLYHSPIVLVPSNMFNRVQEAICCHYLATFLLCSLFHCVLFNYFDSDYLKVFSCQCAYFSLFKEQYQSFWLVSKAGYKTFYQSLTSSVITDYRNSPDTHKNDENRYSLQ